MKTLTQAQISSDQILEKITEIFSYFNISFVEHNNRYAMNCPVHGGDNPEACCVFTNNGEYGVNWKCYTACCEEEYGKSLFGFVRGVLSYKAGDKVSIKDTYKFLRTFISTNLTTQTKEVKQDYLKYFLTKKKESIKTTIQRQDIRSKIQIPSPYYINRGFSEQVLDEFDVGLCVEKGKPMYKRSVVPVYDEDYNYVGCVGRATDEYFKPKWLHSKGFKKDFLYGYNIAKNYITNDTLFLLEGQGDVWRMHEAGYKNSVGIFGASINDSQLVILEESGVLNLVILTDYDDAGQKAAEQIQKKCGRRFNYIRPKLSTKDVGELSVEKLLSELNSQLPLLSRV